jgi:D-sedoheptulose 7-phosphate isomerase
MSSVERFRAYHSESLEIIQELGSDEIFLSNFAAMVDLCVATLKNGNRIFTAGNGGSHADALHIAGELVNYFTREHPPYSVIALGSNGAVQSAWANDHEFETQLSRELTAYGRPNDLVIAITTSGKSRNIHCLINQAVSLNVRTAVLTGAKGKESLPQVDLCLSVNSISTPHIQEGHILIYHALCAEIEFQLSRY